MKKTLVAILALVLSFNANAVDYTNFVESDSIEGSISAPVTMITYASMTCGHCAKFELETMDRIKEEYVKTGKVAYAFRDMPLDDLAMAVSKINRCAPKESFSTYQKAFFKSQRQWIMADDKLAAITNIAKMGGMTEEQVRACILNPALHKQVSDMKNSAVTLGVNSTPSFFINGKLYRGNLGYQKVKALIEAELAK